MQEVGSTSFRLARFMRTLRISQSQQHFVESRIQSLKTSKFGSRYSYHGWWYPANEMFMLFIFRTKNDQRVYNYRLWLGLAFYRITTGIKSRNPSGGNFTLILSVFGLCEYLLTWEIYSRSEESWIHAYFTTTEHSHARRFYNILHSLGYCPSLVIVLALSRIKSHLNYN